MTKGLIHRSHVLHLSGAEKNKDIRWFCFVQSLWIVVPGCDRSFFPCSGNGNGTSWNNRGSNGNYWSASLNSATQGRNLNFNSGGVNPQNNNNRFNGFAVRAVQHYSFVILFSFLYFMVLTKERLLYDLYVAFYDARKHKASRSYVKQWESNLKENMERLCDDLFDRRYKPLPSKCFIVDYPKKREIFAAMFRDRIVHHLYYNYTHEMYERTFIQDSYSCIKGRGVHYGIERVKNFCRKESHNWQRPCYAMHLDIRGYFMHIVRKKLLEISLASIRKMSSHCIHKGNPQTWGEVLDMDFVNWLTEVIVMLDPRIDCIIVGDLSNWDGLDPSKSMLHLEEGVGMPIGNLTSQLFSNVYMNVIDQYIKRVLKCRYYGRYVDDLIIVSADRKKLLSMVKDIQNVLEKELGLELHMGKLHISEVRRGVEFLGTFIKPWRSYVSRKTLSRMQLKIRQFDYGKPQKILRSVNSYLGFLSHTKSYRLRRKLFMKPKILRIGVFNQDITKLTDRYSYYFKQIKNKHNYEQSIRNKRKFCLLRDSRRNNEDWLRSSAGQW